MRELLAHVPFRGAIRERTVEPYVRLLRALGRRSRVKGVLVDVSSGGGESVASSDLYLAVKRLNETKPVFASIAGVGASGAYLAALGARRLFAYPDSIVGSIGVVMPHVAVRDLLRRLGVSVELLHSGAHKDAYQGYRPLEPEERAKLQALLDDGYERFVATVAAERHRPIAEIRALATGETWSGARALELGLVDAVGDREAALEALAAATGVPVRRTVRVGPARPFLERLLSGAGFAVGAAISEQVESRLEDALLDLGSPRLWR